MAQSVSREDAEERRMTGDGVGEVMEAASRSLRMSRPGRRAIDALLRVQSVARPRSLWARMFGVSPITAESERLFASALGELAVGELLSQLDAEWTVLHAVPVGRDGADLDHVVIGPAGVFTVTTRNHPGLEIAVSGRTVLVAGMKFAHIRDAEHDLGRAERRLGAVLGEGIVVTGLLVFVEPKAITLRSIPRDLQVMSSAELLPWLEAQPEVFDAAEVHRIAAAAEQPTTWGAADWAGDDEDERRELDALLRLVDRSRILRQLWFGTATLLIIVTATALTTLVIVGMLPGHMAR